jgi:hypothetical protein
MWRWAGLFVAMYLLFLLFTLPVAAVYGWLNKELPESIQQNLLIEKIQGNIWQGVIAGRWQSTVIPPIRWQWQPWQLFLGKAQFQLRGEWQRIPIQVNLAWSPWQSLSFNQLQAVVPAQAFLQPTGFIGTGEVSFYLQHLKIKPLSIKGKGKWQEAKLAFFGQTIDLGQVNLNMQPSENEKSVIECSLTSQGGALVVSGQLTLRERQLVGEIILTPTAQASDSIKNLLASLATPAADGSVALPIRYVLPLS